MKVDDLIDQHKIRYVEKNDDGSLMLKKGDSCGYYAQMQLLMAACELQQAFFCNLDNC